MCLRLRNLQTNSHKQQYKQQKNVILNRSIIAELKENGFIREMKSLISQGGKIDKISEQTNTMEDRNWVSKQPEGSTAIQVH